MTNCNRYIRRCQCIKRDFYALIAIYNVENDNGEVMNVIQAIEWPSNRRD
jgi:hypothetical protein